MSELLMKMLAIRQPETTGVGPIFKHVFRIAAKAPYWVIAARNRADCNLARRMYPWRYRLRLDKSPPLP